MNASAESGHVFRLGTNDGDIWRSIVDRNEYSLPASLTPDDLIVDIGSHIGAFVYACWERGARRILAYEPDPTNHLVAKHNAAGLASLNQAAVTRSDEKAPAFVNLSGFPRGAGAKLNTGGGDVFADRGVRARAIAFDDIAPAERIRLLKIDCEGSEWPILYTSRTLDRVEEIVGEYHTLPDETEASLGLSHRCVPEALSDFLTAWGFTVELGSVNAEHLLLTGWQKIGLFRAKRAA